MLVMCEVLLLVISSDCFDFIFTDGLFILMAILLLVSIWVPNSSLLSLVGVSMYPCQQCLFPRTARLWHSLPIEFFPLTHDLNGFKSRINRHVLTVDSFYTDLFEFLFLVTPCLIEAVQPCTESIPILKKPKFEFSSCVLSL